MYIIIVLVTVLVLTVIKIIAIKKARLHNFSMFEIFLDISEIQIQQYTSKSEKFLTSLNAEDLNA